MTDWFDQPENVAALIRWLDDRGDTAGWHAHHFADLVEKPWHWTPEYDLMERERANPALEAA